jgi:hypothetical protein
MFALSIGFRRAREIRFGTSAEFQHLAEMMRLRAKSKASVWKPMIDPAASAFCAGENNASDFSALLIRSAMHKRRLTTAATEPARRWFPAAFRSFRKRQFAAAQ